MKKKEIHVLFLKSTEAFPKKQCSTGHRQKAGEVLGTAYLGHAEVDNPSFHQRVEASKHNDTVAVKQQQSRH